MHDLRPPAKPNWIGCEDDGKVGTSLVQEEVRHQVGGFGYRRVERGGEWRLRSVFNATNVRSDRFWETQFEREAKEWTKNDPTSRRRMS